MNNSEFDVDLWNTIIVIHLEPEGYFHMFIQFRSISRVKYSNFWCTVIINRNKVMSWVQIWNTVFILAVHCQCIWVHDGQVAKNIWITSLKRFSPFSKMCPGIVYWFGCTCFNIDSTAAQNTDVSNTSKMFSMRFMRVSWRNYSEFDIIYPRPANHHNCIRNWSNNFPGWK